MHRLNAWGEGKVPNSMLRFCCRTDLKLLTLIPALLVAFPAVAALRFEGDSGMVRVPRLRIHGKHPLTVEFIVTPEAGKEEYGRILSNLSTTDGKRNGIFVGLWKGYWAAGIATNRGTRVLLSDHPVVYGARVHLAAVYQDDQIRMYVNGEPCESRIKLLEPMRISNEDFLIGSQRPPNSNEKFGYKFKGDLEAIRISSNVRYVRKFEAPAGFETDDKTLLFYNFDKNEMGKSTDRSGFSFHGVISNVPWVATDPQKTYDNIEELQEIVGEYQIDRKVKGNATQFTSYVRLTPDHDVLEKDKKIGEWKVEKRGKLGIELTNDTLGPALLTRKRDGSLLGEQEKDGRGMLWSAQRVRIVMLWHQYQYKDERLLKHFDARLYSNGRIGEVDSPSIWELKGNTLIYHWDNMNKAGVEISHDGQSYEGVNLNGHQVMGVRMD